jgi:prepilin-type processing-associated H-X9-DG protein
MLQLQSDYENASNQTATTRGSAPTAQQLSEVARLRAEVDRLRRRTNELAHLQMNQPQAVANTDAPDDALADQQKRISLAKMQDARLLVLSEIMFAQQNQGQVATNFEQMGAYLTNSSEQLTGTNQFELVYHGSLNDITNPSTTLLIREPQSWPTVGGKWARGYAFADGHAEIHVEATDNFDDFEQQHTASAP